MQAETIHDLVIIGAGPSALAAAIYTTREDIETVLYEKASVGGMAAITDMVDNYPGFSDGVEGMKLSNEFEKQATRFGAVIEYGEVSAIRKEDGTHIVTVDGSDVKAKAVLIATGGEYKKIGVPGELESYGRGVHYCATCDGAFYRDKTLAVVGGGNSAFQETIFLTRYASHIDVLVRSTIKASDILQHDMQKYIDSGQVTIHLNTETDEIVLDENQRVTGVTMRENGQATHLTVDGVFVFVGLLPNTQFLAGSNVALDESGHVTTDTHFRTSVDGVFASGDVRSGTTAQIASAVGEGAAAALAIREYIDALER